MSVEPFQTMLNIALPPDEAMSRLVQWCGDQGLTSRQPGPNELECRVGQRSASTLSGLMLGSFSGREKWPAKVRIQVYPAQSQPAAVPQPAPSADRPKFCFNCGSGLPDEGRFCPECGNHIPGQDETHETGPPSNQPGAQVSITVTHDMPGAMLMGQLAAGSFKEKYQERLAEIAGWIQRAWV